MTPPLSGTVNLGHMTATNEGYYWEFLNQIKAIFNRDCFHGQSSGSTNVKTKKTVGQRQKSLMSIEWVTPTFTVGNSSLPHSIKLANQGLASAREIVASYTAVCTHSVAPDIWTIVCTGCRGDGATERSFQRWAVNFCETNYRINKI